MKILRLIYEGYNKKDNSFADCILLMREQLFTYAFAYEISTKNGYPICSEANIDRLIEDMCEKEGGEFWQAYKHAQENGYFFIKFRDKNASGNNPFKVPRFSEKDFESILNEMGGNKIPESIVKTPDFILNNVVYELKDIQSESLYNIDRQTKIGEIFQNNSDNFIDLNPELNYGEESSKYQQVIKNSIQGHFKKASDQIKAYKLHHNIDSAGVILLNTGMFSLPHQLLERFVEQIVMNSTTIDFTFIFSQKMQGAWFDMYATYGSKFIGKSPLDSDKIKASIDRLVNHRMAEMVQGKTFESIIDNMHPISFESGNKIFYWNPGRIKSTLPKKG
jgi:hypothetical protein